MFDIRPFLKQDDPWLATEDMVQVRAYYESKYHIAALLRPQRILEIGVRAGYSAAAFLSACPTASFTGIDANVNLHGGMVGLFDWARDSLLKHFPAATLTFHETATEVLDRLPGERYDLIMGRAAQRHPQQILRVDHEERRCLLAELAERLAGLIVEQMANIEALLISDYAKGACTPPLLATIIAAAHKHKIPILIDPARIPDFSRYLGATVLTPNRAEAELATGIPIRSAADALCAAQKLCEQVEVAAALVKLDSDGMVLVEAGQPGRHYPTRPRSVYDVTGAGNMVLGMAGLCRAAGIPWDETVQLANVAAGLEVEKLDVSPVTRAEIRAELARGETGKCVPSAKVVALAELLLRLESERRLGKKIVFTNGCFDLFHAGHAAYLAEAANLGDLLIVAVNSDASVRRLKGPTRPIIPQADRAAVLAGSFFQNPSIR